MSAESPLGHPSTARVLLARTSSRVDASPRAVVYFSFSFASSALRPRLGRALDVLARYGARPVQRRVVRQGKVITAAGVSSGVDMALTLAELIAGDRLAQAIQLGIEYDPQPPFRSGSVDTAPPEVVQLVRSRAGQLA